MKSMLADIRKGEAEFAEGVNPELKKTIENAIGKLIYGLKLLNLQSVSQI